MKPNKFICRYGNGAMDAWCLFSYVGVTDKKSPIWFNRGNIHEPPNR